MTSDELATARDNLQKAIYSGALEVRFGDRWIRYQSIPDMQRALGDLNNTIATTGNGTTPRSMCNLGQFNG